MTTATPPTRLAVTGHRGLPASTAALVDSALRSFIGDLATPPVGITCLADGADQLFARAVLETGGTLHVIVPALQYRDGLPAECHANYDELMARATTVRTLPYAESTSDAHMAGSKAMLEDADSLLAVWDGQPARGYGGTADIVAIAYDLGIRCTSSGRTEPTAIS